MDDACSDQSAENVENSNNSHSERVDDDDHLSESKDIVPAGVTVISSPVFQDFAT